MLAHKEHIDEMVVSTKNVNLAANLGNDFVKYSNGKLNLK